MTTRTTRNFLYLVAVAAGGVAAFLVFTVPMAAQQNQTGAAVAEGDGGLLIGTYDPQQAFDQYPGLAELTESLQATQAAMQEAHQQGNQQKVQELQAQMERERQTTISKFQQVIDEALPAVANKTEVQAIAIEVVYTSADIDVKDVTPDLIAEMGDQASTPAPRPLPAPPTP